MGVMQRVRGRARVVCKIESQTRHHETKSSRSLPLEAGFAEAGFALERKRLHLMPNECDWLGSIGATEYPTEGREEQAAWKVPVERDIATVDGL